MSTISDSIHTAKCDEIRVLLHRQHKFGNRWSLEAVTATVNNILHAIAMISCNIRNNYV